MPESPDELLLGYQGSLTAARELLARYPLNSDDRPLIEYSAPITHREKRRGTARAFRGSPLLAFFDAVFGALPPEEDPALAALDAARRALPRAGLDLYRSRVLAREGDEEGAREARARFERAWGRTRGRHGRRAPLRQRAPSPLIASPVPPRKTRVRLAPLLVGAALLAAPARAAEPCPDRAAQRRPLFGDLHVHSAYSLDASTQDTRARPADAYRFARGEPLGIQPFDAEGRPLRTVRLARPLDFAAVTDHAELLGEWYACNHADTPGYDSFVCRIYRRWPRLAFFWMNGVASAGDRHAFCGEGGALCREAARGPWDDTRRAAAEANDRCRFTTFVAYEWTGAAGMGENLHRNVIFANDAVPELPASFIETPSPPALWQSLERECVDAGTGCDALVIPHNSNLSAGRMFRVVREDGRPIDAAEARGRHRFERLVEVMQHKGDSECHPDFGSEDELCGFEKLAMDDFAGRFFPPLADPPVARQFVREILKEGLRQEARLGVNPFAFGLLASTDTHLGTPGLVSERADYPGHGGAGRPAGEREPAGFPDTPDLNPGGLAGVWAEENTREAIFAALQRREAFGTSGPRIVPRLFAGWDYPASLCTAPDLVARADAGGVPMGGELPPRPSGARAPALLVSALRDPDPAEAPLQRIQIVKGWLEGDGLREAVYDVARATAEGDVDLDTCERRGAGAASLCAVWTDPDFDPARPAFYYARVLENPSCRWSQALCVAAGVRCDGGEVPEGLAACCAEEHVPTIQERAWTSPIWYRP